MKKTTPELEQDFEGARLEHVLSYGHEAQARSFARMQRIERELSFRSRFPRWIQILLWTKAVT